MLATCVVQPTALGVGDHAREGVPGGLAVTATATG